MRIITCRFIMPDPVVSIRRVIRDDEAATTFLYRGRLLARGVRAEC